MANPFQQRTTEYLRNDTAFLARVTPEPLVTFLQRHAESGQLYDRLAVIVGTPGSGKTTLARLFEFSTLNTLVQHAAVPSYRPLTDALTACGGMADMQPAVLGARVPLESEYREFWEFPYSELLKNQLMIALLQARTVLVWIHHLLGAGRDISQIRIVPRASASASLDAIGGVTGHGLRERARQVERAIYGIAASLVPPAASAIEPQAVAAYQPFGVIEEFVLSAPKHAQRLRPLVIFDDAHTLHAKQFTSLRLWLSRRELSLSRWILTRLDALAPKDVLLDAPVSTQTPGFNIQRETTSIFMQAVHDRARQRRAFRKMSRNMANRYLRQMDVFSRRGLHDLGDLLATTPTSLPTGKLRELRRDVDGMQARCGVSDERREELENMIDAYFAETRRSGEDLRLSVLRILFERYAKRMPQRRLFGDGVPDNDSNRRLSVGAGVVEGAGIHMLQKYGRPHYFGIDALCDSGSENAERFLHLADRLVSQLETRLIRGKTDAVLESATQHRLLVERAAEIIKKWDFPEYRKVRRLAHRVALKCRARSLEGSAPLGAGANAVGVLQEDFDRIPTTNPELARVLQFGVAYNAFLLAPSHGTKNRLWCLIELGGVLLLHYGLTLRRGGFLECTVTDLEDLLQHDG